MDNAIDIIVSAISMALAGAGWFGMLPTPENRQARWYQVGAAIGLGFLVAAAFGDPSAGFFLLFAILGAATGVASLRVLKDHGEFNRATIRSTIIGGTLVAIFAALLQEPKAVTTMASVLFAIALSAAIFVAANKAYELPSKNFVLFRAITGGTLGLALFSALDGNRVLTNLSPRPFAWPAIGLIAAAAAGAILASTDAPSRRLPIGLAAGTGMGLLTGLALNSSAQPSIEIGQLLLATVIGSGIFVSIDALSARIGKRAIQPTGAALFGAAIGWVAGSFGLADLGGGSTAETVLSTIVPGALVGIRAGLRPLPDASQRTWLDINARKYIFLLPSMTFIIAGLVIPLINTAYLSITDKNFLDRTSGNRIWFDNYTDIFTDEKSFDIGDWQNIFTSRLFIIGMVTIAVGLLAGVLTGRRRGQNYETSSSSVAPVMFGALLLSFAVFTSLRGTIINNLWWVFLVTVMATALGLAAAVLADRLPGESVAKSIIFMPMAISFVGAGIIWRFVYIGRPPSTPQTGLVNAIWLEMGDMSRSGTASKVATVLLIGFGSAIVALGLWSLKNASTGGIGNKAAPAFIAIPAGFLAYWLLSGTGSQSTLLGITVAAIIIGAGMVLLSTGESSIAIGSYSLLVMVGFIIYRLMALELGGQALNLEDGTPIGSGDGKLILFTQEAPWNNVFLMLVLIWIQTGFAMVIFSSAIKAVPTELVEAASIDGASDSQVFWKITIPQIGPTIGVVVTTLIVTVMKVFDIVRVMSGGNFGTQVVANEMWSRSFVESEIGAGSALAMVLFIAVMPVMYINIRRMQSAEV